MAIYHRVQRGSTYVMVLATSTIITAIGLASLLAIRVQRRSVEMGNDAAQARLCAQSAVEIGLQLVKSPNWRTTWSNGAWLSNQTLGSGSFTLQGVDPRDGDLDDSQDDPVVLTGIGMKGTAVHKVQITLIPAVKPLEALDTCVHSLNGINIHSGDRLTAIGAPVSTNGNLDNNGIIDGSVEAGSIASGGTITGTVTDPAPSKQMPDSDVISDYISKATWIPYTSVIDKKVLTPTYNPWGFANSDGVYYIYTHNNNLTIRNSRIQGTLVVRSGQGRLIIDEAVFMQSYRPYYPTLVVDGRATIQCRSGEYALSETTCDTNYNPGGAPYLGQSDNDKLDEYPNEIQGLVYVTRTLGLKQTARIRGVVICGDEVQCKDQVMIIHDPALYVSPPEGYIYIDGVQVSPASCKQVVD